MGMYQMPSGGVLQIQTTNPEVTNTVNRAYGRSNAGAGMAAAGGSPEMAAIGAISDSVTDIIGFAWNFYIQQKQEEQARQQNAIIGQQYRQERGDAKASQEWQQNFMKDQDQWNRYQTNLANIRTWGKDIEGLVNKNQELKSVFLNIWNKSRSY